MCLCLVTVQYVKALQEFLASLSYGSLASLVGRYYAMDRDKRYERTKIAFEALVQGSGEQCHPEALAGLMEQRYAAEGAARQTDEFMKPIITDKEGCVGGEAGVSRECWKGVISFPVMKHNVLPRAFSLPTPNVHRWRHTAVH